MNRMKLGEILSVKHGWAFKGEYFAEDGEQSILTPGNFFEKGGFKPNNGKERYYTGTYPKEYLCHKGDLIVAMTQQAEGLLGSTALVPENNKYLHNQRIGLITCDEKRLNKLFAYYLFMTKSVREQLERSSSGTKVKHTSPEKIYDVEVEIPDVISQQKIANLLWAIDEKIANNKAINDNLSAMAYDIYMHTFFSKKPNAKLKDILTEAEKSAIQVGEAKTSNGEYPFFTSGATILKWNEPFVDGRNCFLNTGGNADVKFYVGKAAYSTDTWSISAKSEMSDYLYLMLFSIKPELDQKFFQGTGLKHLQKPLLKDRPIYIPEKMELEGFNRQVMPMFDIISENTRENQQLTSLRDWLLPMLMNGQATISD
ncbi:type I restriction enzyme, S subunit [Blautia sp. SF-50]|nr:restriction endonuclease subunit S [Blautia sp. SF-50]SCY50358.1 type I restriction enzyme, S subunit [Blautia sp. SF-50]